MRVPHRISFVLSFALACASAISAQTKPAPPPAQASNQTQAPAYNPKMAVHDVDVGKFYWKRGDVDGAIARYKDALRYNPNFPEPCLLLGQAYEQKHDPASAISYYQQYLKILPDGSESKKVRKRIADLQEKMKKDENRSN
jgi:tetratricopeptide (TPR) repeat protein